ncbi:MAG: hypothetical protein PVH60_04585 [Anaerolineales bacterium]|jgi:hypothetical protein
MSFLQSISPEQAEGEARELYQADEKKKGYISNYTHLFSLRPEVLTAWRNLQASIRRNMRLRRYELATLAAAIEMKCTY